jgi:cyclopropane fatty-acyl-phospholipid synthase-like methyltransferase
MKRRTGSMRDDASSQVTFFYDRHPISCGIVLARLKASRGHLDGLNPEELWPHDQDHYGGTQATDELAAAAQIGRSSRVADFCAGLGGTVRYLAHRYGADVTGIELTQSRALGAEALTRRVGLSGKARVIRASVLDVPLREASMDAVVSQEAFCHVPELNRALGEAWRILRKNGRLAFTDWVAHTPLEADDAGLMWDGMAIQPLRSIADYRDIVARAGFIVLEATDLTEQWRPILAERLRMYQQLREEARRAGTPAGHDAFHRSYVRFVDLIQRRALGGVRIVAVK